LYSALRENTANALNCYVAQPARGFQCLSSSYRMSLLSDRQRLEGRAAIANRLILKAAKWQYLFCAW